MTARALGRQPHRAGLRWPHLLAVGTVVAMKAYWLYLFWPFLTALSTARLATPAEFDAAQSEYVAQQRRAHTPTCARNFVRESARGAEHLLIEGGFLVPGAPAEPDCASDAIARRWVDGDARSIIIDHATLTESGSNARHDGTEYAARRGYRVEGAPTAASGYLLAIHALGAVAIGDTLDLRSDGSLAYLGAESDATLHVENVWSGDRRHIALAGVPGDPRTWKARVQLAGEWARLSTDAPHVVHWTDGTPFVFDARPDPAYRDLGAPDDVLLDSTGPRVALWTPPPRTDQFPFVPVPALYRVRRKRGWSLVRALPLSNLTRDRALSGDGLTLHSLQFVPAATPSGGYRSVHVVVDLATGRELARTEVVDSVTTLRGLAGTSNVLATGFDVAMWRALQARPLRAVQAARDACGIVVSVHRTLLVAHEGYVEELALPDLTAL